MRRALAILTLLGPCSRPAPPAPAPEPRANVAEPAPSPPPPKPRFNVLLLTIDSLRADMPWAGYARPIAPRLQALHDRSMRWTRAYATSSFTSKSIPGLLTGRLPSELPRTGAFFTKYLTPESFACTSLSKEGIKCIGAHAHMYFAAGQSGFESGFETWKIVPGITFDYQTDPYVTSDKLTALAMKTLETPPESPFLAWFHYMDPHDKYQGHDEAPHFGKGARDLYDEEVFFTDHHIGRLLDFVDQQSWAKSTAIIVTADHGEAFGEHGMTRHAHEIWEELVRVPLFVYVPGMPPKSIDVARGHADVMPTIAELLGAKSLSALPGKSLLRDVETAPEERDVIVDLPEDEYNERRRAIVHETTKLIAFGKDLRFALYDLASDPKEKQDLSRSQPELLAEMKRRYREANARIVDVPPRGGIPKHD